MVFEHVNSHTLKTYREKTQWLPTTRQTHTPFIRGKNTRFRLRFWVQLAMQIAYLKLYFGGLTAWQCSCFFSSKWASNYLALIQRAPSVLAGPNWFVYRDDSGSFLLIRSKLVGNSNRTYHRSEAIVLIGRQLERCLKNTGWLLELG